jgi:hypothetical protein
VDYNVFVFSSRDPVQVALWLEQHGFKTCVDMPDVTRTFWSVRGELLCTQRKLPADAYVDDRGVRFENWKQALRHVLEWYPA